MHHQLLMHYCNQKEWSSEPMWMEQGTAYIKLRVQ